MSGGPIKEQQKGGMLIDADGLSDMKDGHNDGSMRASHEQQDRHNDGVAGLGYPFSGGERFLRFRRFRRRRRRLLEEIAETVAVETVEEKVNKEAKKVHTSVDVRKKGGLMGQQQQRQQQQQHHQQQQHQQQHQHQQHQQQQHQQDRRRGRSLLMLDDLDRSTAKLLNPKILEGTVEDPLSPENAPYVDPRSIASSNQNQGKDATTANMYDNPETMLVTEMHVCINEDNMHLAKALFLKIASKDVEVECRMFGT